MKLSELEVKDPQIDEFVGRAATAVARGAGKVIGGISRGVGAIAGIGQGIKTAYQKGRQASVDVIGGTGQGADAPAPAATQPAAGAATQPAATQSATGAAQPAAAQPSADTSAQPATGAAQPAAAQPSSDTSAQPATGAAQPSAGTSAQPAAGGQQTNVTLMQNLQDRILQLDTASQRAILKTLQSLVSKKSNASQETTSTAQTGSTPAAQPATGTQPSTPETPSPSTVQQPAAQPATNFSQGGYSQISTNAPTGLTPRQPAAGAAKPGVGAAAQPTADAQGKGKNNNRPPTQAEIDADRERIMGSIIRKQPAIVENFSLFRPRIKKNLNENPLKSFSSAFNKAAQGTQSAIQTAADPDQWKVPSQSYQTAKEKTYQGIMKAADPGQWFAKNQQSAAGKSAAPTPQQARAKTAIPRKDAMLDTIEKLQSNRTLNQQDNEVMTLIYNAIENDRFQSVNKYLNSNPRFKRSMMMSLADMSYNKKANKRDMDNLSILKDLLSKER